MEKDIFNPEWLSEEFFNNLGYVKESDDGIFGKYISTNKCIKHKIKGYNQPLGYGQRIIAFNRDCTIKGDNNDEQFLHIGIRCDGDTRALFNGVIQTEEDLLTIIRLID